MIADDDVAFNIDQTRTGESAVRAHRQHNWIRFIIDRDPDRARPFVDGVVVRVVNEFAAAADSNAAFTEPQGGHSGGVFIDPAEDHAGFARACEFFLGFGAETDQVHEAGFKALAHAADRGAAEFQAAPGSDGCRIVRESLRSGYLLVGCLLGRTVLLILLHLLFVVPLTGGGQAGLRAFVGSRRLRADQSCGPVLVENTVHLVLTMEALEGRRFGRSVSLRVVLRHLVGG